MNTDRTIEKLDAFLEAYNDLMLVLERGEMPPKITKLVLEMDSTIERLSDACYELSTK